MKCEVQILKDCFPSTVTRGYHHVKTVISGLMHHRMINSRPKCLILSMGMNVTNDMHLRTVLLDMLYSIHEIFGCKLKGTSCADTLLFIQVTDMHRIFAGNSILRNISEKNTSTFVHRITINHAVDLCNSYLINNYVSVLI